MTTSVRSYLVAGAAAATATAIALTPVQAAPADIAVPAHPASTQPQLTQAMVDLLAAASRMTAAVAPKAPSHPGAPGLGVAPAAATTGDIGVQNAASDWLSSVWYGVQSWIDWGVNYAQDIAYWLGGWGVPFAWAIGDQIGIFYNALIKPIANGYFDHWLVPVVNDPLNPAVWWNGFVSTVGAAINAGVNFGVQEFNFFFGWILPPLPGPPPGWPFNTLATQGLSAGLATPGALFPGLRGLVGDVVLPPSGFVTDAAVNTITGAYGLVHNATSFAVNGADNVLDSLRLNFLSRQLDINYNLVSALSSQGVGLTTDLIQIPDRYLDDVLNDGQGLLEAAGTEAQFVGKSIASHGNNAVNAVGNYVDDQINYFTPGSAATETNTDEVAKVPTSVRASLQDPVDQAKGEAPKLTSPVTNRNIKAKTVDKATDVQSRVQTRVQGAVDAAQKAGDDARQAVKTAVKNVTPKPRVKKEKSLSPKDSNAKSDSDNKK
ncbi:hypothetical protein [Mycolicibacterium lutetiense]|uniref:PE-PPE domain-containing protein n=1 Tax=Mycolicibacterium lutetiense TaxID=1641992 RepID=A0ABS4ZMI8_9MYCO|nr:hypothetical protein [Mycolicibacterium lutetiense]MBP2450704.1 hypothetical protein [Mycolicibacterium lutetiense]